MNNDYKGKKIAVLGLGITGKSVVEFLIKRGAEVSIFDDKSKDDCGQAFLSNFKDLDFYFDGEGSLDGFDLLMVSPGVKPIHPKYKEALEKNIPIKNDLNLFLDEWNNPKPEQGSVRGKLGPVVGVTGSNGKSTIVTLLNECIKDSGRDVILAGNIGIPALDFFKEDIKEGTIAVIEMSNYQLELFDENYFADIAVITNITDNHLDRYKDGIKGYVEAKSHIFKDGETEIVTVLDDEGVKKHILPRIKKTKPYFISLESSLDDFENSNLKGICTDEKGNLVLSEDGEIVFDDLDNRKISGLHNLYNIAITIQVCELLGIDAKEIKETIRNFKGLEHRIQFIDEIDGVSFVNDSKSTSPDATLKALEALGTDKNIILIAGGESKGVTYKSIEDAMNKFVKRTIILPGDSEKDFRKNSEKFHIEYSIVDDMHQAVMKSKEISEEGDIILLSPGSASLKQFGSFEKRGDAFIKEVEYLKTKH